jgi:plastocyanin
MKRPVALLVMGAGLAAAWACGGSSGAEVLVKGFRFQPKQITVSVGGTVTWVQEDNTVHTITSGTPNDQTGLFDNKEFAQGEEFSFSFERAGTYPYFCRNHPEGMRGTVTVE